MEQTSLYDFFEKQKWATLYLFDDDYPIYVSNFGDIKTPDQKRIRKNGRIDNRKGRILKPKLDKYGYKVVLISHNCIRKYITVHKLVAMAWIPNEYKKATVNHKDGNKLNNCSFNLEWATQKEQKLHSIKNGLCENNIKALENANKRKSIPVSYKGKTYNSLNQASRETGLHSETLKKRGVIL